MATFSYFLHPPRDNFAETMTEVEQQTWGKHFAGWQELLGAGQMALVGGPPGRVNTGVSTLGAPEEAAARQLAAGDPVTQAGLAEGDLRPFSLGMMRSTPPAD